MSTKEIFEVYPLFEDVQMLQIFADGKTFVDCNPKQTPTTINQLYHSEKDKKGFDLKSFVLLHFEMPAPAANDYKSDIALPVEINIENLWPILSRQPDKKKGTLIPLPYPYIVPGGRFGEIYYWDSYFTMLGLKATGKYEVIENMVNNFSYLIDTIGYIPNGNRTYFIGRSQPPFYSLMIRLLASVQGDEILIKYLPQLEKEYQFWMKGINKLSTTNTTNSRVVKMKDDEILNRYWDENNTARPESYKEDVELMHQSKQESAILYRHLRAAAESGWDFSCRWFKDVNNFGSIHTTDIIPVDLNCLLFHLEETIAIAFRVKKNISKEKKFASLAIKRKNAINKYCFSEKEGFFFDYDFVTEQQKNQLTLAGVTPLFLNVADQQMADSVAQIIENTFLKDGGLVSTPFITNQQWDAPNGWAPLQWMVVIGLENFSHSSLAKKIASRWLKLNTDVFKRTGKLMEKYNVVDTKLEAGGGEYPGQDGFGWTNGVFLALLEKYGK